MLNKQLIRLSTSPHAAPTFCVKKSNDWRVVHDYRELNENTIRQSIPIKRKDDILEKMSNSKKNSTVDLPSSYYQIRMKESDIPFTAFQTPTGLFEYLVVPMGVCNAPSTLHRLTNILFNKKDILNVILMIYIFTLKLIILLNI